jgi:peptidoglycan/LPS O-acetylase OafA/YrhL
MPRVHLLDRESIVRRSDGIDLLRALFALWVIAVHLGGWGPLTSTGAPQLLRSFLADEIRVFQQHGETNPAVIAFIVLSGYCIHRNGARREGWSTRTYAIKRAFRIWPVYIAACIVGAVLFVIATHENATIAPLISGTGSITPGCMAVKLSGIAAVAPGLNVCGYEGNAPLVTVAVEIWLYAVYALGAVLLLRGGRQWTLWLIIGLVAGVVFLLWGRQPADWGWWNNGSLPGFLPYWWIGAALVGGAWRRRSLIVVGGGAGVFAVTTIASYQSTTLAEFHALSFAILIGYCIRLVDERVRTLPRPLTMLGRSGYSLYAFHAPILIVLVSAGAPWWVCVIAAVAAGNVAFWIYERPLTLRGRQLARRVAARSATPPPEAAPARA